MFIQHLATTTHNVVKAERKPRRNIQYRDVNGAISKTDNLEFAVDVVPKVLLFKDAKKRVEELKRVSGKEDRRGGVGKGQKTLDRMGDVAANGDGDGKREGGEEPLGDAPTPAPVTPVGALDDKASRTSTPLSPVSSSPAGLPAEAEAMEVDVDMKVEKVDESEPEDDAAARQLEMEMRGPQRRAPTTSPVTRRSTGGFTAINGAK
jgi:DNA polymerase epsilon subunit 4